MEEFLQSVIGVVPLTRLQRGRAELLGTFYKFVSDARISTKNDDFLVKIFYLKAVIFTKLNFPQISNRIISPITGPPLSHRDNPLVDFGFNHHVGTDN